MNPELINYIAGARRAGMPDPEIKQNLLNQGWQSTDVEAALTAPSAPTAAPQPGVTLDNHTLMAVLAYLGILIVIPFLMAKDNPFVKFHLKQGLAIIVTSIAYWFVTAILGYMHLGLLNFFIYPIVGIGLLVLEVIGIVNAVQGKQKELPILGQLAARFNF